MESLTQPELASRLTMNCVSCYVEPQKIWHLPITIMDVFDQYALSNDVREDMYKCYPNAKLAHLKNGGNFPYLSRSAEVNLHLQVCYEFNIKHEFNIFIIFFPHSCTINLKKIVYFHATSKSFQIQG